jgi:phosphate-selective porin OprO/OprP
MAGLALSAWFVCLHCPHLAHSQEPPASPSSVAALEKRVRELEAIVRQLQAERTGPAPIEADSSPGGRAGAITTKPPLNEPTPIAMPEGAGEKSSGFAGWDDKEGFVMRSADKKFMLRLTGQIQGDYRAFLDGKDVTDIDTFIVRRARLGIEANMFGAYEFRLLPDFSNAQAPGTPGSTRIQDAYMNVHYWDEFQVEVGKFKQPFSYEQLVQDRFVPTLERSIIDQLVPARDEGVMIHGQNLLHDRLDYATSVSNGEINGDFDTEKRKDFAARIAIRPFNSPEMWGILQGLQLGMSATTGKEEEAFIPTTLRTPATVPFFNFNPGVRADGIRERYSPEVVYFHGPLGIAAQYYYEEQRLRPVFSGPGSQFLLDVPFTGGYVMGTYLLTGEERTTYSAPVDPLSPFDPCHPLAGTGAWELVARFSKLDLGAEVFQPLTTGRTTTISLANPNGNSRVASEITLGFNWYLNRWVRVQFNYEHSWFADPVRLGPTPRGLVDHQDALLTRLQVIF